MTKNLVFLVDINTCYVSCERVFDPSLRGKPVVVLSNNDGCVVALSKEAKALGVRMGEPWFQLEPRAKALGVIARSSNYELYGHLSDRVMDILRSQAALFEQYSIDEAFLTAPIPVHRARAFAQNLKATLARKVGLPVCVGVGSTKTLAKLANRTSKKIDALSGVCVWEALPAERRDALLGALPTGEVWGVGRKVSAHLSAKGIHSIADLAAADPATLRKQFSVVLMRTALELRGTPAIELETERKLRDQLIYSRMFSAPIETREDMRQALSVYAQRASRRLQADRQVASQLTAFCGTSYFSDRTQHHPGIRLILPAPTGKCDGTCSPRAQPPTGRNWQPPASSSRHQPAHSGAQPIEWAGAYRPEIQDSSPSPCPPRSPRRVRRRGGEPATGRGRGQPHLRLRHGCHARRAQWPCPA